MGYFGQFKSLNGDTYTVKLGSNATTEIRLADNPFTVTYNTSATPFEPVRTSTATIRVVHNNYLEDILSSEAQGTEVTLLHNDVVMWTGYLTPKIYSQNYVDEYETIELEAADSISSLQYIDYSSTNERGIVSFKTVIDNICTACGNLKGYYWTTSKQIDSSVLTPELLAVSEQNFFSSDTDESWKLNEVLKEICRYLGFTALQYRDNLYILDYQTLSNNGSILCYYYDKSNDYTTNSTNISLGAAYKVTSSSFKGSGATIDFEPVYNKCKVNANFYNCEDFIPNIFDDALLTNRNGEFYECSEIQPIEPYKAEYPFKSKTKKEETADDDYTYYCRLYDNKYWESVYRDDNLSVVSPTDEEKKSTDITKQYVGGTIVDVGVVKKTYIDEYGQYQVPNKLDYDRYVCINQKGLGIFGGYSTESYPVFKLKDGFKSRVMASSDSYLILDYSIIFEKHPSRNYINPDWNNDIASLKSSSATKDGKLYFKLKIGDKYWNGKSWTTTFSSFPVVTAFKDYVSNDALDLINKEKKVLNNVSYDLYINESGYKIPLNGVDTTSGVEFEIYLPTIQFVVMNGSASDKANIRKHNAYCWIKDLSIKVAQSGQDVEKSENDVIYENVINDAAISELDDITVKLTTYTDLTKPSYSNVIYLNGDNRTFLSAVKESALSGNAQKPEENIIEKYVNQYSTQTKKLTMTLGLNITPLQLITNCDVDNPNKQFVELGTSIDYANDCQTLTAIELK